jgi:outer membrane protein FlgP
MNRSVQLLFVFVVPVLTACEGIPLHLGAVPPAKNPPVAVAQADAAAHAAPVPVADVAAAAKVAATSTMEAGTVVAPLVERRETLTATGYAVISVQNHRNPAQQRLLAIRAAKLDAYRALTEQVYGLKVEANATVADMVVQNDTFRSRVEGVIFGATLVSITPAGDDTYEVTLTLDRPVVQDLRSLYLSQMIAKAR